MVVLASLPATAQSIAFGVKAGVPVTDSFVLNNQPITLSTYKFDTQRYTVGPTFQLGLPHNLVFEADALYKRLTYTSFPFGFDTFRATTTASSWEFPLLVKRYFLEGPVHPYGDLGLSIRRVNATTDLTNGLFQSTQQPLELAQAWSTGFAAGGGVDVGFGRIHLLPEVRYTRWRRENFSSPDAVLGSNLNSIDVLLGVTFRK
jgi:opacity protein-like surface antigen